MRDYSKGVHVGEEDREYLQWLAENPLGIVVNLDRDRDGRQTLHRSTCQTISYDLEKKGQRERGGKVCFNDEAEFTARRHETGLIDAELNDCSRCHSASATT